jgi:hypothetical protein
MAKMIMNGEEIIAVIIPAIFEKDGLEFFTPKEYPQQLAYMNHPEGHQITPHVHKKVKRTIEDTMETIFVRKGRVKVDFYTSGKKYLESRTLVSGDVILLVSGGHSFTMLEKTEMIEVKQGPYLGENDKEKFS